MNMTDRFNPANENDPKRKLAYGLIALACVIALGFGLDAASCSRTGTAGDEGGKQDATEAVDGGSAAGGAPLGQRVRGVFRLPPLSLWTPLSPGQVVAPSVCYGP